MLPKEYKIRNMSRNELDIACEWAANEGWNPGLHDIDVFWNTDPKGFYALDKSGELIGSVSGVSYNGEYGFGGFFILRPEFRNQRLGTELANYFLSTLSSRLKKDAAIGIDGVFNMQPTYSKWGFKFSHRNLRMESKAKAENYLSDISEITDKDFEAVNKLDTECFGFDRQDFLKAWLKLPESKSYKFEGKIGIEGYGTIRKCVKGYKIGALFASDYLVAHELFKALSSYADGDSIYLDTPEINDGAMKLARAYDMKEMYGCARMYIGAAPNLPYNKIFGVTTFELG